MTDHPAIVALAKVIFEAFPMMIVGNRPPPTWETTQDRELWLSLARAAYAAVLRDVIAQSQPEEFWFREIITARAREIGVEVE